MHVYNRSNALEKSMDVLSDVTLNLNEEEAKQMLDSRSIDDFTTRRPSLRMQTTSVTTTNPLTDEESNGEVRVERENSIDWTANTTKPSSLYRTIQVRQLLFYMLVGNMVLLLIFFVLNCLRAGHYTDKAAQSISFSLLFITGSFMSIVALILAFLSFQYLRISTSTFLGEVSNIAELGFVLFFSLLFSHTFLLLFF